MIYCVCGFACMYALYMCVLVNKAASACVWVNNAVSASGFEDAALPPGLSAPNNASENVVVGIRRRKHA